MCRVVDFDKLSEHGAAFEHVDKEIPCLCAKRKILQKKTTFGTHRGVRIRLSHKNHWALRDRDQFKNFGIGGVFPSEAKKVLVDQMREEIFHFYGNVFLIYT